MPAAISGPTGIPPINATPITVPINSPVIKTGCCPIKGTPRPASQATKIPIKTADIILKFKNSATGGTCAFPETNGLKTPSQKNDTEIQPVLLDQRDKLYQCRLLHQQQYGCRDGNRIVVADHPQQNQRNQKQGNKTEIHRLKTP